MNYHPLQQDLKLKIAKKSYKQHLSSHRHISGDKTCYGPLNPLFIAMQKVIIKVMILLQLIKLQCLSANGCARYQQSAVIERKMSGWLENHICPQVTLGGYLTRMNIAGVKKSSFYQSPYWYENMIFLFTAVFIKCISYYVVNFSNTMNIFSWKLPKHPFYRMIMPARNTAVIQPVKCLPIHSGYHYNSPLASCNSKPALYSSAYFLVQPVLSFLQPWKELVINLFFSHLHEMYLWNDLA